MAGSARTVSPWGMRQDALRRRRDLSLVQLAARSGVARSTLTIALRGLSPEQVAAIERALEA